MIRALQLTANMATNAGDPVTVAGLDPVHGRSTADDICPGHGLRRRRPSSRSTLTTQATGTIEHVTRRYAGQRHAEPRPALSPPAPSCSGCVPRPTSSAKRQRHRSRDCGGGSASARPRNSPRASRTCRCCMARTPIGNQTPDLYRTADTVGQLEPGGQPAGGIARLRHPGPGGRCRYPHLRPARRSH